MREWTVSESESGIKLLAFLKNHLNGNLSARQIKEAINRGLCLVNHRVERFASTPVGFGDKISLRLELFEDLPRHSHVSASRVLFEDEELLVYNKPEGVIADHPHFLKEMQEHFPGVRLVHRLDRETTGALLFAKNAPAFGALTALFKDRKVSKTYLAIADGCMNSDSGVIENFLGKLRTYQGQTVWGRVAEKGLYAKTSWKLLRKGGEASLVSCNPETGRTHQIRVHLSEMGHPILGDYQYSRTFACDYVPSRYLLHAWKVSFEHPSSGQVMRVKAPIPQDFRKAMETLFGGNLGLA